MPSRRDALAAAGSALFVGLAGCSESEYDAAAGEAGDATDWPTPGHDNANTRYIPDGRGPREGVTTRWRVETGLPTAAPTVAGDTVFAPVGNDVLALDAATGEGRWRVDPQEDAAVYWAAPTVADGVAYLSGDRRVRALDVADGTERWSREFERSAGELAPTLGYDGHGLFVAAGETVYRLHRETGEIEWSRRLFGHVRRTMAYRTPFLFAVTEGGDVYALSGDEGTGFWRTALPDTVQCVPTCAGQRLYVGCFDGNLYAIDHGGAIEWSTEIGGFAKGGIGVAGGTVYADGGRELHALDAESGEQRWAVGVGTTGDHPPVIVGDTIYTGGEKLHALKSGGGLGVGDVRFEPARFTTDLGHYVGPMAAADGSLFAFVQVKRDPNGDADSDNLRTELRRLDAQPSG